MGFLEAGIRGRDMAGGRFNSTIGVECDHWEQVQRCGWVHGVMMGVLVGRGVGVLVGVGETYQRSVGVGVRVGGITAVGVTSASGG